MDGHDDDTNNADHDYHQHHTTIWSTILAGRRRGRPHSIHSSCEAPLLSDGQVHVVFEPTGLAAARMDIQALRVVKIPALAIETVCCSVSPSRECGLRAVRYTSLQTSCHTCRCSIHRHHSERVHRCEWNGNVEPHKQIDERNLNCTSRAQVVSSRNHA
jgi:hypothetical protein